MLIGKFNSIIKIKHNEKIIDFVGNPCFMAPEKIEQKSGYNLNADIWSLGMTAIEICQGSVPYSDLRPMQAAMKIYMGDPPTLSKYFNWSDELKYFISDCLQKDPIVRISAPQILIKHAKLFSRVQDTNIIVEKLLSGIPPLEKRVTPDVLRLGDEYFNHRYQEQAAQNGVLMSHRTKRKKVEWIFEDDEQMTSSNPNSVE